MFKLIIKDSRASFMFPTLREKINFCTLELGTKTSVKTAETRIKTPLRGSDNQKEKLLLVRCFSKLSPARFFRIVSAGEVPTIKNDQPYVRIAAAAVEDRAI